MLINLNLPVEVLGKKILQLDMYNMKDGYSFCVNFQAVYCYASVLLSPFSIPKIFYLSRFKRIEVAIPGYLKVTGLHRFSKF